MYSNLLSLAIWVPISQQVCWCWPPAPTAAPRLPGLWLLSVRWPDFSVTLPLFTGFDRLSGGYQFTKLHSWIPALNINYALGVDGISVLFVILNSFITLMVVLAGWQVIQKRTAQYMAAFLIMSGLINGAFAAQDAILFYVLLRGHADSALPDYRYVGRPAPRVCFGEAVSLYLVGLFADAGGLDLSFLSNRRQASRLWIFKI